MEVGILTLIIIGLVGFVDFYLDFNKLKKTKYFVTEYINKFRDFANRYIDDKDRFDGVGYEWLLRNSPRIESKIGHFERFQMRPPFANYIIKNYQVTLNTIPKFREGSIVEKEISFLDDFLIRSLGTLDEILNTKKTYFYNPFRWFFNGVKVLVQLPIKILFWSGLIGDKTTHIIQSNLLFRIITFFVGLIGFVGSIASIISGKEEVIKFVINTFSVFY